MSCAPSIRNERESPEPEQLRQRHLKNVDGRLKGQHVSEDAGDDVVIINGPRNEVPAPESLHQSSGFDRRARHSSVSHGHLSSPSPSQVLDNPAKKARTRMDFEMERYNMRPASTGSSNAIIPGISPSASKRDSRNLYAVKQAFVPPPPKASFPRRQTRRPKRRKASTKIVSSDNDMNYAPDEDGPQPSSLMELNRRLEAEKKYAKSQADRATRELEEAKAEKRSLQDEVARLQEQMDAMIVKNTDTAGDGTGLDERSDGEDQAESFVPFKSNMAVSDHAEFLLGKKFASRPTPIFRKTMEEMYNFIEWDPFHQTVSDPPRSPSPAPEYKPREKSWKKSEFVRYDRSRLTETHLHRERAYDGVPRLGRAIRTAELEEHKTEDGEVPLMITESEETTFEAYMGVPANAVPVVRDPTKSLSFRTSVMHRGKPDRNVPTYKIHDLGNVKSNIL